ncbi:MAG: dihydrofolate reductase family protein [Acidobacteriaceae bacterium]
MRKIILSIPITLDGYIEGPHRELDWVNADDDLHDYFTQQLKNTDLLLFGRVAYELLASYWPNATSDPNLPRGMVDFANTINPLPKIVFSRTLEDAGWNTSIRRSIIPAEIVEMKNQPGKDIGLSGGASIAQAFLHHALVDEIRLMVQPVAIGNGKSLFGGLGDSLKLELLSQQAFESGAVALCYRPDGKLGSRHS